MKRILAVVAALGLLAFGAMAYAHWEGGPGYGPGYGMGYGPGGYGMGGPGGPGSGGCGRCGNWDDEGGPSKADIEKRDAFLKESRDLRKKLHDKMFDLREAYTDDDEKKADAIEKEIEKLQEELAKLAEKHSITQGKPGRRGYGRGPGPGYGPRY